jgi:neutral amino acid transport system ATP-binding protein
VTAETVPPVSRLAGVAAKPGVVKPDPILVADNVSKTFGGLRAVQVSRLEVQRGAITALIGPNGAGKTTLFNLLTGFDRADAGRWSFESRSLTGLPAYRVARAGLVRTFQLTKSLTLLTVLENLKLASRQAAAGARGNRVSAR